MIGSNEAITELASILAAALQRVRDRQSSQNLPNIGESLLHFSLDQSGGVPPLLSEASHD
jgi:hypothetical protein